MQMMTSRSTAESVAIDLEGRFDAFETAAFGAEIEAILDTGIADISVELTAVNFIDSSGLAELVRAMKRCRSAGGDLTLVAPSGPVQVILELTRLDLAFTIVDAPEK